LCLPVFDVIDRMYPSLISSGNLAALAAVPPIFYQVYKYIIVVAIRTLRHQLRLPAACPLLSAHHYLLALLFALQCSPRATIADSSLLLPTHELLPTARTSTLPRTGTGARAARRRAAHPDEPRTFTSQRKARTLAAKPHGKRAMSLTRLRPSTAGRCAPYIHTYTLLAYRRQVRSIHTYIHTARLPPAGALPFLPTCLPTYLLTYRLYLSFIGEYIVYWRIYCLLENILFTGEYIVYWRIYCFIGEYIVYYKSYAVARVVECIFWGFRV
jgi:hypothetical protein